MLRKVCYFWIVFFVLFILKLKTLKTNTSKKINMFQKGWIEYWKGSKSWILKKALIGKMLSVDIWHRLFRICCYGLYQYTVTFSEEMKYKLILNCCVVSLSSSSYFVELIYSFFRNTWLSPRSLSQLAKEKGYSTSRNCA